MPYCGASYYFFLRAKVPSVIMLVMTNLCIRAATMVDRFIDVDDGSQNFLISLYLMERNR